MTTLVNGYLVVETTSAYQGVDREPWGQIVPAFYAQTLPAQPHAAFEKMSSERVMWWPSCSSREEARDFLRLTHGCELIAVRSPYVRDVVGREYWAEEELEWLGVDVIAVGEWSLLRVLHDAGIAVEGLNDAALLEHGDSIELLTARYRDLAAEGRVEPIADSTAGLPVEAVHVFRAQT